MGNLRIHTFQNLRKQHFFVKKSNLTAKFKQNECFVNFFKIQNFGFKKWNQLQQISRSRKIQNLLNSERLGTKSKPEEKQQVSILSRKM